jgi:tetratricopeptide (TPR) repeat protein
LKIKTALFTLIIFLNLVSIAFSSEDFNDAWVHFLQERYNVSERIVDRHLRNQGNVPEYIYLKSLLLMKRSNFEDARVYCDRLSKFGAKWSEYALLGHADTFFLSGDFSSANSLYDSFVNRFSGSDIMADVIYKHGLSLRKQGSWSKAREKFNLLIDRYPNSLSSSYARRIISENEFYFTIQVGSFLNYDNAYNLSRSLTSKGFDSYIKKIVYKGKLFYRVRVGKFDRRSQVDPQFKSLLSLGYSGVIYP